MKSMDPVTRSLGATPEFTGATSTIVLEELNLLKQVVERFLNCT